VPESPAKLAGLRRECGDGIISRPGCVGGGTWLPPWRGGESDSRSQGWLAWKRRRRLVGRQRHNGDKTNSRIEAFLGIHLFFLYCEERIFIFSMVFIRSRFFLSIRALPCWCGVVTACVGGVDGSDEQAYGYMHMRLC
jgi:hypothetical protein